MLVHEVQILRTTSLSRDAIGGPIPVESSTTVQGYLEPLRGSEDLQNRNTEIGVWMLIVGPEVDIIGWDRVVWGSRMFEVTSPPEPHTNVRLNRTEFFQAELQEIV